jgi:hypothetical protein
VGESRSVTIMKTDFLAGLTRIKAKTLSGIGSGSRVRSGPSRVAELRHFPYLVLDGLSRIRPGYGSGKPC